MNLSNKEWVLSHKNTGATSKEMFSFFDSLPVVTLEEMMGTWRGSEIPTGHPLDGLLEATKWYGKDFVDAETVYPLLFSSKMGKLIHVDSRYLPFGLMSLLTPFLKSIIAAIFPLVRILLKTDKARARLRMVEHRGKVSATMVYDFLPIHDVFRRIDSDLLLGLMDQKGQPNPFFFVLERDQRKHH